MKRKFLTLNKTSESDTKLSYIDISISICSSKYVTEVYYKRDAFNFNIVNFPYMSSNIPANPIYGVYISQLIRISRIWDTFQSFVIRHRLLTERLIKQGLWYSELCKFFKKFARRYYALFGVSVRTHVHEGICIPLVVKHEQSKHNIITTSRGVVHNCILHDHCIPAAMLRCCYTTEFCHFPS